MLSFYTIILFFHLVGLSLAVGAATIKNILFLKCYSNYKFIPVYKQVVRPITKTIITGMILLTASGISWFFAGYSLDSYIIIKIVLFLAVWVIGPIIDNVFEPRFLKTAPAAGESPSKEFLKAKNLYMVVDFAATGFFYAIIIMWILR